MTTDLAAIRAAMPWAPLPDDLRPDCPPHEPGVWHLGKDVCVSYSAAAIRISRHMRCVMIYRTGAGWWAYVVTGHRFATRNVSTNSIHMADDPKTAVMYAMALGPALHGDLVSRVAEVVCRIEASTKQAAP